MGAETERTTNKKGWTANILRGRKEEHPAVGKEQRRIQSRGTRTFSTEDNSNKEK